MTASCLNTLIETDFYFLFVHSVSGYKPHKCIHEQLKLVDFSLATAEFKKATDNNQLLLIRLTFNVHVNKQIINGLWLVNCFQREINWRLYQRRLHTYKTFHQHTLVQTGEQEAGFWRARLAAQSVEWLGYGVHAREIKFTIAEDIKAQKKKRIIALLLL